MAITYWMASLVGAGFIIIGVLCVCLRYCFLVLLLCGYSCTSQADVKHYVVEGWIESNDYISKLLRLILEASKAPDEVIDLKYNRMYEVQLSHSRRVAEFSKLQGNLVMWTVTNKERESFLRPIRVPIFKGLFGYRALIIRKEDQAKFATIATRQALAEFVAGQGDQWPDAEVLRNNGLPLVTGTQVQNMYKMLAAKRFDYFPRALVELVPEMPSIKQYDLMVVPDLLLEYPNPMYFFVHKSNTELAGRLERGWEIIISNGAFDRLFYSEAKVQAALQQLNSPPHHILHLQTPNLPEKTPLHNARYWLRLPLSDSPP